MTPGRNPDKGIAVAFINAPKWYKMHRIVWSVRGICPCITAGGGGNLEPKILVEGSE